MKNKSNDVIKLRMINWLRASFPAKIIGFGRNGWEKLGPTLQYGFQLQISYLFRKNDMILPNFLGLKKTKHFRFL